MTEGDILLVEDDPDIATILGLVLARARLRVTTASTLDDALAALRERAGSFDAIVADKNLPDGSGIQLLQEERARGGDAELVVISGFPSLDSAVAALRLGAYDYIEKPFRNLDDVVATVVRAVRHRRVRRERDEARARALRAERTATLVQVAAGLAHEVKNPLQGMGFATTNMRMALDAGAVPPAVAADLREQVDLIEAEARRLRDLVEGVMDLARPAPRPVVDVDVAQLLSGVRRLHAARLASHGGSFHLDADAGVTVRVDEADLERAVDNLVRNAVEATAPGGSVWVNARRGPSGAVEITVEDRGPGFNVASREGAFRPFFTTKARGFGLGLCQVAAAAERAGGEVIIEDAVPCGARVVLRIPTLELPVPERLRILLVDDDAPARRAIASFIARGGDEVNTAEDGAAALARLGTTPYDLVLSDVRMPRLDGIALTQRLRERNTDSVVVLMSAFASIESVIAALRLGVYDYLLKPVEPSQLAAVLGRVRERLALRRQVRALTDAISARDALAGLVAAGPAMTAALDVARRASACDLAVLITGESGTGKDLLARAIHGLSARAAGPFASVDCAALDPAALERTLFDAPDLTASPPSPGLAAPEGGFRAARGGTLLIEEVTALPLALQARLVHAVEDSAGQVRVVATAGDNVEALRRDGRFRNDLYFSLRTIEVRLPPLRERREDIPRLVEHFLREARAAGAGGGVPGARALGVSPEVLSILMAAPWPGNVRELESVMRGAAAMVTTGDTVGVDHLPPALREIAPRASTLAEQVLAYERAVLRQALESVDGQVGRAARMLGVPERTLRRKMRQFGIAKEAFRKRAREAHLAASPDARRLDGTR